MKTESSRGILIFAHNNTEIDYLGLALTNALLIQKNLGLTKDQITIVTDPFSLKYKIKDVGKRFINKCTSNIIEIEKDREFKLSNNRTYKDTSHTSKQLSFYNVNRCDAYDLSPYDETIMIDADYLILSNTLNHCWGHQNNLMMNWEYVDIMRGRRYQELDRLSPLGISMYWATVVYFRKDTTCETFFNFVKHVKDNREYYSDLYKFNNSVYRNDFSFSIGAHMLSGYKDKAVQQLPTVLYKTWDLDDVHKVTGLNSLALLLEKPRNPGDFILTHWRDVDLHVMNKWALNRVSKDMIQYLGIKDAKTTTTKTVNKKRTARKKKATAGST